MAIKKDGFDEFGNPLGKAYDLGGVDDDRLHGEKILLYVALNQSWLSSLVEHFEWHLAQQAVAVRNLQMDVVTGPSSGKASLDDKILSGYSQLWFVSDLRETLTSGQVELVHDYVNAGNGLLIWADNEPFFADANLLAKKIVGTQFSGNKLGDKVMIPGSKVAPGKFIEHPLTQGVNSLYEGVTICTIAPAKDLTILAQSHDSQLCMACFERGSQRVVLDTGFTKLIRGAFHKTAGTARYFRNIAFWLSRGARNVEYKSFTPGRESLATLNPGSTSERYKYTVAQPTSLSYVLHWEGAATLGLVVQDPQGSTVYDSSSTSAPLRFDLSANIPGDWVCWVKGVQVPRAGFPYVLTLVLNRGAPSAPHVMPVAKTNPTVANTPKAAPKVLPIFVIMDTSEKSTDLGRNLDLGLGLFVDRLRARLKAGSVAHLGLILADESGLVASPPTDVSRFTVPAISRRGKCNLGRALGNLLFNLGSYGDAKPLVFVLLTGRPDDDWTKNADQLRELALKGKATVLAVGVGGYADSAVLKRLTPSPPLSLPVLTQAYSQQTFEWLYQIADVVLTGLAGNSSLPQRSPPLPSSLYPVP